MSKLKLKRSTDISTYTPDVGEPIFDISKHQLRIGNGTVAGGIIPREIAYTEITSNSSVSTLTDTCVLLDCRENSINVELPDVTNLPSGSIVKIIDAYYAASEENPITVSSTAKINNLEDSFVIDLPRAYVTFIWISETENWLVDLGGIIIPSYEISTTSELHWTEDGELGVNEIPISKLTGDIDCGTF